MQSFSDDTRLVPGGDDPYAFDEVDGRSFDVAEVDLPVHDVLAPPPDSLRRQVPRLSQRVADLVVVRESDEYDHILMDGCIQHTLSYCSDLPGVEVARELGVSPLTSTRVRDERIAGLVEIKHEGTRAVLMRIESTWFLYSEASAAKGNAAGENNFTLILTEALAALRPRVMHVVAVSRVVRDFEHAGLVQTATSRNVDEVRSAGVPIRMRGAGKEMGQMMWATLATISATERDLIVQRLAAGVVAKFRRGQWTVGTRSQPLGYPLDPVSRNLVLDAEMKDLVAMAWTMMADETVTAGRLVHLLGAAGVSTPTLRSRLGDSATVADLSQPPTFVRHMLHYAELYRTGRFTQRLANPFAGASQVGSLPVRASTKRYPHGHVDFDYDFGLPPGGWVEPTVIDQAIRTRTRRQSRQGAAARPTVLALSGRSWSDGDREYRLSSMVDGVYRIGSRHLSADGGV